MTIWWEPDNSRLDSCVHLSWEDPRPTHNHYATLDLLSITLGQIERSPLSAYSEPYLDCRCLSTCHCLILLHLWAPSPDTLEFFPDQVPFPCFRKENPMNFVLKCWRTSGHCWIGQVDHLAKHCVSCRSPTVALDGPQTGLRVQGFPPILPPSPGIQRLTATNFSHHG